MAQFLYLTGEVNHFQFGQRLDQVITAWFPYYSRSQIKSWILNGLVKVNGRIIDIPKKKCLVGECIEIKVVFKEKQHIEAQQIKLDIIYEDHDILVINKPRNMLVHPGVGHSNGTVLNALLYYFPPITVIPRAGIVHRLDKDTTGLMVIAKTIQAQINLIQSIITRDMTREYEAIATGTIISGGTIAQPIARHAIKRKQMTVHPLGKPAVTHYRILERFRAHTHLSLRLDTGRTHQIRVHVAYMNHPLVGDPLYGKCPRLIEKSSKSFNKTLRYFDRQALHASVLKLHHPISNKEMEWKIPLPQDMVELVKVLKSDTEQFKKKINLFIN